MTYYSLNDTYYTMDNLANTVTAERIGTSVTYDISGHYQSKLYVYVDTELLEDIFGIHFEITSTRADVSIAK